MKTAQRPLLKKVGAFESSAAQNLENGNFAHFVSPFGEKLLKHFFFTVSVKLLSPPRNNRVPTAIRIIFLDIFGNGVLCKIPTF